MSIGIIERAREGNSVDCPKDGGEAGEAAGEEDGADASFSASGHLELGDEIDGDGEHEEIGEHVEEGGGEILCGVG